MMTLDEMKQVDPRTVSLDSLTDIADVRVNTSLPPKERLADYLEQVGNPYCFRCGNVVVQISYADTDVTFEDVLEQFIRQRQLSRRSLP